MTPILQPSSDPERKYNAAQIKSRNCVERCIGVLKGRWRCLQRNLKYSPEKVSDMVLVCAALHNICIANRITLDTTEGNEINSDSASENIIEIMNVLREGQAVRNSIVSLFE